MYRWKRIVELFVVSSLITSPVVAATVAHAETATATVPVGEKVNINTASVKDLMTLDGVGRRVAEKIVQYREAHGPFKKPEEIRKVEGIGGGLWEKNRERILVK